MCGIAGAISLDRQPLPRLEHQLAVMNQLQRHRGPDGHGVWSHPDGVAGFAHRRLSIIDLSDSAGQPMTDHAGNWVVFNGEIYNYRELRDELGAHRFRTHSDTEVLLEGYRRWGLGVVDHLRGMFAFALWDEAGQRLVAARDRFGMKPLYFTNQDGVLRFASECKALLPFMESIDADLAAVREYLTFQFCLEGRTLFRGINEVPAAHLMVVEGGQVRLRRYWDLHYEPDTHHTFHYFQQRLGELIDDSIDVHLRSDVPVGAYVSGGLDSSAIAALAARRPGSGMLGFNGRFTEGPEFDESHYAQAVGEASGFEVMVADISGKDFVENIEQVIYHLDYPVAGPGAFSQYMVSRLAAQHRKVVLGGQGGDEIFGGYARYLVAYFEQCIKAAIDGTARNGNFVVTYESIIPNLDTLRAYKPMLQSFWREGLFGPMEERYFRLVDRAPDLGAEIRWEVFSDYSPMDAFKRIFHGGQAGKESYFDLMTHFDIKTLLPALLQVEDRVSMAHGLESRVPLLDHPIVEFAATMPADVKFKDGSLKHILRETLGPVLPPLVANRRDKMGFPTPFNQWVHGEARDFVLDTFQTGISRQRSYVDTRAVVRSLESEPKFGRRVWGLLSLEIWHQQFEDRASEFRRLLQQEYVATP